MSAACFIKKVSASAKQVVATFAQEFPARKYPSVGHSLSPWSLFAFLGGSITRSVSYATRI